MRSAALNNNRSSNQGFFNCTWFKLSPELPVVMIAWEDAIVYCNWLSRQHHLPPAYDEKTGRLLTRDGKPTTQVRLVDDACRARATRCASFRYPFGMGPFSKTLASSVSHPRVLAQSD